MIGKIGEDAREEVGGGREVASDQFCREAV